MLFERGSSVPTQDVQIRESVSRFFPGRDKEAADRLVKWLDQCGYRIMPKTNDDDQNEADKPVEH
jgi:hypothetical protein